METTTIHLLRHGEVNNPEGVLYGRLPGYGLTPLGEEMAQVVADFLVDQGSDITHVIASPLLRAQLTATPTALAYDLPVETDPRLVEVGNAFEGQQINKNRLILAYPRNWKLYAHPNRPSWGEPYGQVLSRMSSAISSALEEARGHEALLVSHQSPIVMVQRFLDRKPLSHNPLSRRCSLASLSSLVFEGNTLVGWYYNEPAKELLKRAQDMVPGTSEAEIKK
ncbi:histidine phosphatase family protein [Actinomycetaceae bacterium MB13-C1-2]|nr:histidine phosphatase family protein [Actinomycetaceae bacterium MB13-C1-2]